MNHAQLNVRWRGGDDEMGERDRALTDDRQAHHLPRNLLPSLGRSEGVVVAGILVEELHLSGADRVAVHTSLSRQCEQRPAKQSRTTPTNCRWRAESSMPGATWMSVAASSVADPGMAMGE